MRGKNGQPFRPQTVGGGTDASGMPETSGAELHKLAMLTIRLDDVAARLALFGQIVANAAPHILVVDRVWRQFFALKRTIWSVGE